MTATPASQALTRAIRGRVLHFLRDPQFHDDAYEYWEDGVLIVTAGRITAAGDYAQLAARIPAGAEIVDHRGKLIVPGFIDTHVHYPQTDIDRLARAGPAALAGTPTPSPTSAASPNRRTRAGVAGFFLDELLRNGTTTRHGLLHRACGIGRRACSPQSERRNLRMIAGKVLMDRNCPGLPARHRRTGLRATAADLLPRWHGSGRLAYAITPRFAPTSTEAQLQLAGELARAHTRTPSSRPTSPKTPTKSTGCKSLFPDARSYLDVYDRYGLLRPRALYGHCIWLDDDDRDAHGRHAAAAAALPDFQPVPGQRPVRLRARRRSRRGALAGHRRRRRHLVLACCRP